VGEGITRRKALGGAAAGALGIAGLATSAEEASAAPPTVRGSWLIMPKASGAQKTFTAIAAFAAGGVFLTIGSDEPGTGIGAWSKVGAAGFSFSYTNYHFGGNGKPSHTVEVKATGTFKGATMNGNATLTILDPATGKPKAPPVRTTFTGKRVAG